MASLRNAIPRKTHKERAQPAKRARFGLLEKHKDYVERAQDFHRKVERINNLKRKAAERNPDEFYFGMLRSKTQDGVHQEQRADGADTVPHHEIKSMKSQDLSYLHMMRAMDERKAAKLQDRLHMMPDSKRAGNHTLFFDTDQDVEAFDAAEHFDTAPQLVHRAYNRPRKAVLESDEVLLSAPCTMGEMRKLGKQREVAYKELDQRTSRSEKLRRMIARRQTEKDVMSKGKKRKVADAQDGRPAVFKWKRQRAK